MSRQEFLTVVLSLIGAIVGMWLGYLMYLWFP